MIPASRTASPLSTTYGYVAGGYGTGSTTPLVANIQQTAIPFSYAYDSHGNIISETRSGQTTTYEYDALGQLTRVNDPHENATWVYAYDRGGNMTSKVKYAYTTGTLGTAEKTYAYSYGDSAWKDKLTYFNGRSFTYDAIGNPLSDSIWSYTWQAGRQLKKMSRTGVTIEYRYDHNGLRTQKLVTENGTTTATNYTMSGKRLVHLSSGAHELHFFYDAQGRPAKVDYNGTVYTYVHNLQGDVAGILDSTGALVVEYKYDAWGRATYASDQLPISNWLCLLNPFRYRGYIYDSETGMYYLRSRYYNPEIGRFLNEDGAIIPGLLSTNLFAYCSNNPLSRVDTSGYGWNEFWQSVGNWFSDLGNRIGDELKYQTKIKTEVNIRMAKSLDEKLLQAGNWIKKKASDVGNALGSWWNGSAKPWIKQAWEDTGNFVKNVLSAQQQADILSAQMTYHAASKIGDWFSENWLTVVDWITAIGGTGGTIYGIVQTLIPVLPVIPVAGQVLLLGAGLWGIARLAGWF